MTTTTNHGFSKGSTWLRCLHWPKGCLFWLRHGAWKAHGSFDKSDHFDQMLSCTSSQEGQFFKMFHQDAHGLVKSAILNGHA